jgi:hypothetical protein
MGERVTTPVLPPRDVTPHRDDCDCRLCRPRPLADDVPELAADPASYTASMRDASLIDKCGELGAHVFGKALGGSPAARMLGRLVGVTGGALLVAERKKRTS